MLDALTWCRLLDLACAIDLRKWPRLVVCARSGAGGAASADAGAGAVLFGAALLLGGTAGAGGSVAEAVAAGAGAAAAAAGDDGGAAGDGAAAGVCSAWAGGVVDGVAAMPGQAVFDHGTRGHDLHTTPPTASKPPTAINIASARHGRRFGARAPGAKSSLRRTLPPHMLISCGGGTARRRGGGGGSGCVDKI